MNSRLDPPAKPPVQRVSYIRHIFALLLVFGTIEAAQQRGIAWFDWTASTGLNPAFQEAWAWRIGRLDLRYRLLDAAYLPEVQRVYNVYPPLITLITYLAVWMVPVETAMPTPESMPAFHILPLIVFGISVPLTAYAVFFRRTRSVAAAALLTLALVGGSAVMPCIAAARQDYIYHQNHLLSQVGLLLLAGELFGRRRAWVLLVGLLIAAWTRQLTIFFALPILYVLATSIARLQHGDQPAMADVSSLRFGKLASLAIGIAFIVCVPLAMNQAKFGNAFDSGYQHLYHDRTTPAAINARQYGLFSPHFVGMNAYYMNTALPFSFDDDNRIRFDPSPHGTALWFTTPIALLAVIGICRKPRDQVAFALCVGSMPIVLAHLFYHNTGYVQHGYYRFALDYLPVWLVAAAPWLMRGRQRWLSTACILWSVAYFAYLRHALPSTAL
ncbi:MAG: hypothetical protein KF841_01455 [Phycisphaerae bacterium]|nr:hypothetical protein [Phycisphaerae bacterium]